MIHPLLLWKKNQTRWPLMAGLAKIVFGVPVSSAKYLNSAHRDLQNDTKIVHI